MNDEQADLSEFRLTPELELQHSMTTSQFLSTLTRLVSLSNRQLLALVRLNYWLHHEEEDAGETITQVLRVACYAADIGDEYEFAMKRLEAGKVLEAGKENSKRPTD